MQYDFKVDLDEVYKYFVDEIDNEYLNFLKQNYEEFRIKYNDSPVDNTSVDIIETLEGINDHYQIILVGIKGNKENVLCYYFVGEDYGDDDPERNKALEDFEEVKKCRID
ncbi:hypothetical protein [Clostridium perfringens]|uniref:hypothetical protein n=1 Tax=Clostridium perfringens TaxID=1502 RepID=UPI0023425A83|nr:hypothetical protein [Clostridium perfringens]MDC4245606.1 hypothetical protein [Clostridium perfringens]